MNNFSIPTLYYTLNNAYTDDEAYKTLLNHDIFDLSFSTDSVYSHQYKTATEWIAKISSSLLEAGEDDLFIICNAELSFIKETSTKMIVQNILEAGKMGAQILLGNIETARDLYRINNHFIWTDLFYRTSFIVVYKSAFKRIADLRYAKINQNIYLEQILSLILDYKFVAYPFFAANRDCHLGMNEQQTWYDGQTAHFYEGIHLQIKTLDDKLKLFQFEESAGYPFNIL